MIIIAVIWCVIGALFGVPRARARYKRELDVARKINPEAGWRNTGEALFEAAIEQTKWTLLGILSGISYLAWLLLEMALANKKELEKPNVLGAFGFSFLIFVLALLALESPKDRGREY